MALFQQLVADQDEGLGYAYMGFAEYEFGSTSRSRAELAEALCDGKIFARKIRFTGRHPSGNCEFDAVIVAERKFVESLPSALSVTVEKAAMQPERESVVGWMTVLGTYNVILFRDDENLEANVARLDRFLSPMANHIRDMRAKRSAA